MFVDAFYDRKKSKIRVTERIDGKRQIVSYPVIHSFCYPDEKGIYEGVDGIKLSKFETQDYMKYKKEISLYDITDLYETDQKPVFKCLEQNYLNSGNPDLHLSGLDIETAFCKTRGYASPDDPHQPVTSITLSWDWDDRLITLVVPPPTYIDKFEEAAEICDRFDNTYIFENERQMFEAFLDLIGDVDIFYTWNGEGFDIPYLVNRISQEMGSDYTKKLCLFDQMPTKRNYIRLKKNIQLMI